MGPPRHSPRWYDLIVQGPNNTLGSTDGVTLSLQNREAQLKSPRKHEEAKNLFLSLLWRV